MLGNRICRGAEYFCRIKNTNSGPESNPTICLFVKNISAGRHGFAFYTEGILCTSTIDLLRTGQGQGTVYRSMRDTHKKSSWKDTADCNRAVDSVQIYA